MKKLRNFLLFAFILTISYCVYASQDPDVLWSVDLHNAQITELKFSPDDQYVAVGYDGGVQMRNANTGELIWEKFYSNLRGLDFSTDSRLLITSNYCFFKIWDVESGNLVSMILDSAKLDTNHSAGKIFFCDSNRCFITFVPREKMEHAIKIDYCN